jgi:hypothetical protein
VHANDQHACRCMPSTQDIWVRTDGSGQGEGFDHGLSHRLSRLSVAEHTARTPGTLSATTAGKHCASAAEGASLFLCSAGFCRCFALLVGMPRTCRLWLLLLLLWLLGADPFPSGRGLVLLESWSSLGASLGASSHDWGLRNFAAGFPRGARMQTTRVNKGQRP